MRANFRSLFIDHPASVGETYLQHFIQAVRFGASMLLGALACFLHAVVPRICATTASRTVARLYDRMVVNRTRARSAFLTASTHADSLAENI